MGLNECDRSNKKVPVHCLFVNVAACDQLKQMLGCVPPENEVNPRWFIFGVLVLLQR